MTYQVKSTMSALVVLCAALAVPVMAEQGPRYQLKRTGDGFVRLDTQTGSVAHCAQSGGTWQCKDLTGGQPGQQDDLARLHRQNAELRERIARLEAQMKKLAADPTEPRSKLALPSDDELDQIMGFFEKFLMRFRQLAETLQGGPSGEDI